MPGRVFPADAPRPVRSYAERKVWEALKRDLPNGWTAWHSLRIRDGNNYLGEGDFALAHPERGLLVLEVKGGQLEQRDGRWFSSGVELEKAPLDQALGFVKKLVRRLEDDRVAPPTWGAAVAFPDTELEQQPPGDDLRGVVLGRTQLTWLAQALPGVVDRALPPAQAPQGAWVDRLHRLWGATWVPALGLGTRVRELGEKRFALDDAQLEALEGLFENERVLVRGGAGSGKTLLAAEAARRLAEEGKRVLLLCFTQPLRQWLAARLAGTGVEVQTVSGHAKVTVDAVDGASWQGDLTDSEYWRKAYERAVDLCEPRWDAVIVDEGQDLTFEAWVLVGGLARGARLWAFHDPGQGYWPERTPPAELFGTRYTLPRGRRCPVGVEALANRYLGAKSDPVAIEAARKEGRIKVVPCPDPAKVADVVGAEVDRLLSEKVAAGDIGIVSLRGQTAKDAVYRGDTVGRHAFVHADHPEMEDRLVADTFLRWKGLERPVIVVADVPSGELKRFGTRMYIALTRALVGARIVAPPAADGAWPGLGLG